MRIVLHSIQITAILYMVMLNFGCTTHYNITADPKFQGKIGYEVVDTAIKQNFSKWKGPDVAKVGANENGLTLIEMTNSTARFVTIPNYIDNGSSSGIEASFHGKLVTYKWTDIDNVKVIPMYIAGIFCGLGDPTAGSLVKLSFKNGNTERIESEKNLSNIFPFWLFCDTDLSCAKKTGTAIQTILDLQKEHQKNDPIK